MVLERQCHTIVMLNKLQEPSQVSKFYFFFLKIEQGVDLQLCITPHLNCNHIAFLNADHPRLFNISFHISFTH